MRQTHTYYPDFIVKETVTDIWLIETKGREDLEDPHKWARLKQWCADATAKDPERRFHAMLIREEEWKKHKPRTFKECGEIFGAK